MKIFKMGFITYMIYESEAENLFFSIFKVSNEKTTPWQFFQFEKKLK